jgi:hypothetical protein
MEEPSSKPKYDSHSFRDEKEPSNEPTIIE